MSQINWPELFPYFWSALILAGFLATRKGPGSGGQALRITRLEAQVQMLMKELKLTPPVDPLDEQVRLLLQTGRAIEAIKLVRASHDLGLKDAKDYVEALKPRQ